MTRRLQLMVLAVVTALALAGCGGGKGDDEAETGPTVVEDIRVRDVIQIAETEYALTPRTTTRERIAFYAIEAKNDGDEPHALRIVGPELDRTIQSIEPGDSKTFAVALKKHATYRLTCPLDGHAAKGMRATIVVG